MIYGCIEENDWSAIKIGYAKSPNEQVDAIKAVNRVKQYQTGNKRVLYVVVGCIGSRDYEAELHREFSEYRIRQEWFSNHGRVRKWASEFMLEQPVPVPAMVRRRAAAAQKALRSATSARGAKRALSRLRPCARANRWCDCARCKSDRREASAVLSGQSPGPIESAIAKSMGLRTACMSCGITGRCKCVVRIDVPLEDGEWIWQGRIRGPTGPVCSIGDRLAAKGVAQTGIPVSRLIAARRTG